MTTRLSRESAPAAIDGELSALWTEAGRDTPVARARISNLVVIRERAATETVDLDAPLEEVPVDEVARRHPSRIIVLHHGGRSDMCQPVAARVSIVLFGTPPSRFGVEQIAVRSACADVSLPSIIRRLALGDLPTAIWWTNDFSPTTPLQTFATLGRQFVYDSRRWRDVRRGVLALAPLIARADAPDVADVNWRRLTPIRQAVAQGLSASIGAADPRRIRARIHHRPGDGALAWLAAGWLASRLEWPAGADWPVTVDEIRRGDEVLSLTLEADADTSLTATLDGHKVLVRCGPGAPPLVVAVPHEIEADALAAELNSLNRDTCLHDALASLGRRFERH